MTKQDQKRLAEIVRRHADAGDEIKIVFDMKESAQRNALEHSWHDIEFLLGQRAARHCRPKCHAKIRDGGRDGGFMDTVAKLKIMSAP